MGHKYSLVSLRKNRDTYPHTNNTFAGYHSKESILNFRIDLGSVVVEGVELQKRRIWGKPFQSLFGPFLAILGSIQTQI